MNRDRPAESARTTRRFDAAAIAGLVLFTLATRVLYAPARMMGFDGPEYVNALKLDATFNVPPPGNIGYVLLGKVFALVYADPVRAYIAAGIVMSCWGVAFVYLFSAQVVSRWAAVGVAACVSTSAMVWYHGLLVQSYIVWLAALPTIGYWSLRFARERTWETLIAASLTAGTWTIFRPDLVVFGGPLLGAGLVLGRARVAQWAAAAAICAACCCVWFFGTAQVVGGVDRLVAMARERQAYHEGYGASGKGLLEGVLRNSVKYAQFLSWSVHIALVPAAIAAWWYVRRARVQWRAWVWAIAWGGPSLAFAMFVFTGSAGFVLPLVPLVYLAAGKGVEVAVTSRRHNKGDADPRMGGPTRDGALPHVRTGPSGHGPVAPGAVWLMLALAAVNLGQFVLTPLPRLTDQRRALLTHMFFGYSGAGLRRGYDLQLSDFGIDKSLKGTVRQFMHPEPLPVVPERLPPDMRP